MRSVDLNCDMGEGDPYDRELMDYVSSVNVACGGHAGDERTMYATVMAAVEKGVAIGAHPSFPDRANFGRKLISISPEDLYDEIGDQVSQLITVCQAAGTKLRHVKPHGALYNIAASDRGTARTVARAVRDIDASLIVYGLSGGELIRESMELGLRTASEVFADRTYSGNGDLTARSEVNAIVSDAQSAARRALSMVTTGRVLASNHEEIAVLAETICIHGDTPNALHFAAAIHGELIRNNIKVCPLYA